MGVLLEKQREVQKKCFRDYLAEIEEMLSAANPRPK